MLTEQLDTHHGFTRFAIDLYLFIIRGKLFSCSHFKHAWQEFHTALHYRFQLFQLLYPLLSSWSVRSLFPSRFEQVLLLSFFGFPLVEGKHQVFAGAELVGLVIAAGAVAGVIVQVAEGKLVLIAALIDEQMFAKHIAGKLHFIIGPAGFFRTFVQHSFDHAFPSVGLALRLAVPVKSGERFGKLQ